MRNLVDGQAWGFAVVVCTFVVLVPYISTREKWTCIAYQTVDLEIIRELKA